jgi:diguanylate cyclase (GGDEF)-like protein
MPPLDFALPPSRRPEPAAASTTLRDGPSPGFTGWAVLDSLAEAVITTDRQDHVTYINTAAEALLARSASAVIGQSLHEVLGAWSGATTETSGLIWRDGDSVIVEVARAPLRDDLGQVTGSVVTCRDTASIGALARELSHRAAHDELTGLPNRHVLQARLAEAMAQAARDTTRVAVCFVDVDGLKAINDQYGHLGGDWVLTMVAERLTHIVRNSDTVARFGGDEFVVVLPKVERRADAEALAESIAHAVARPVHLSDHWVDVSASVGLALYPDQGQDVTTLLAAADAQMAREADVSGEVADEFGGAPDAIDYEHQVQRR